jgi:uncharacterized membrane protein required for colicin V production
MILDLVVLLIILLFGFLGLRNGFAYSIVRFMGWIGAMVLAVIFHSYVSDAIKDYTMFYEDYHAHINAVCHSFMDQNTSEITGSVPGSFGDDLSDVTNNVIDATAENIANASFNLIVLIIMVILIKFIFFLFTMLFSKKYHDGFVGGIDGIAGCILGVVQAVLIVLVLLALLMPLSLAIGTEFYDSVNQQMDNSLITGSIYANNPFLSFVDGFVPDEFLPSKWVESEPTENVEKNWENLV